MINNNYDKYVNKFKELNFMFESYTEEEIYIKTIQPWMLDENRDIYYFNIDENKSVVYSDGEVAIISNRLFESEGGGVMSTVISPFLGFVTHGWHNITEGFEDLKDGKFTEKVVLGLGSLLEFLTLISALIMALGLATGGTASVVVKALTSKLVPGLIGAMLIVGGIWELYKPDYVMDKKNANIKQELEKFSKEKNKSLLSGITHIVMGVLTMIFSYSKFGKTLLHKVRDLVSGYLKKFFSSTLNTISNTLTKSFVNLSQHGLHHTQEHFIGAQLGYLLPLVIVTPVKVVNGGDSNNQKKTNESLDRLYEDSNSNEGGGLSSLFSNGTEIIKNSGMSLLNTLTNTLKVIKEWDTWVLNSLKDKIVDILSKLVESLKNIFTKVMNVVKEISEGLGRIWKLVGFYQEVYKQNSIEKVNISNLENEGGGKIEVGDGSLKGLDKSKNKEDIKSKIEGKMKSTNENLTYILSFDNFVNENNLNFNN
jgi:hypothetical protein